MRMDEIKDSKTKYHFLCTLYEIPQSEEQCEKDLKENPVLEAEVNRQWEHFKGLVDQVRTKEDER